MARKALKNLAIGVCCVALAWVCARLVFALLGPAPVEFRAEARPPAPRPAAVEPRASGYEAVLARNLFGTPIDPTDEAAKKSGESGPLSPEEEERLAAELDKLPISQQGWTLLGTIVNTLAPDETRAILVVDNVQAARAAGDEIKGWRIAHIDRRRVVVERNGRRERLLVGGRELILPDKTATATKLKLNRSEMERAMRDLPALMTQAGFAPDQRNGVFGLNLTFVKPESIFARLGLRANDLLVEANGQTLTSIADLGRLGGLARENRLRVELLRDGENVVLEYEITR